MAGELDGAECRRRSSWGTSEYLGSGSGNMWPTSIGTHCARNAGLTSSARHASRRKRALSLGAFGRPLIWCALSTGNALGNGFLGRVSTRACRLPGPAHSHPKVGAERRGFLIDDLIPRLAILAAPRLARHCIRALLNVALVSLQPALSSSSPDHAAERLMGIKRQRRWRGIHVIVRLKSERSDPAFASVHLDRHSSVPIADRRNNPAEGRR